MAHKEDIAQKQAHDQIELTLQRMKDQTELLKAGTAERRTADRQNQADLKNQVNLMERTLSSSLASARGQMKSIDQRNQALQKAKDTWKQNNKLKSMFGAELETQPEDITETKGKIENTERALMYLNYNNNPDTLNDENKVRNILATTDSILSGEGPETSRSQIKAQYPTATTEQVDKVINALRAQGYKVNID
jgi:chromosome segregation ATPase